jgi:hypothetical protein
MTTDSDSSQRCNCMAGDEEAEKKQKNQYAACLKDHSE